MARCELSDLLNPGAEKSIITDEQRPGSPQTKPSGARAGSVQAQLEGLDERDFEPTSTRRRTATRSL
jgi:hypothetical protein